MSNVINDGVLYDGKRISSFLMLGQSNMAGRGELNEVAPIRNPLCYMLRMGRWQPMSEPINPDRAISGIRYHSGVSLAASFADCFAKKYDAPVGLIPCADGGTKISQWKRGELLYDHAVMLAKLAMRTSDLKGILWHQGESDCLCDDDLNRYSDRFLCLASSLRRDLGIEDLPIIFGELSYDYPDKIKMEKRNIEFNKNIPSLAEKVGNCAKVSSEGLELKDDGLHFNSKSCREFGKRYFEAYCSLEEKGN